MSTLATIDTTVASSCTPAPCTCAFSSGNPKSRFCTVICAVIPNAMAYVYPHGMRATRDLRRRRLYFVRRRSELFAHIRMTFHQLNLLAPSAAFHHPPNRSGLAEAVPDPVVRANVEADLALAKQLDEVIASLEQTIRQRARVEIPDTFELLQTIPGIGPILALTLLYELHDIERFPRVQDFLSYARLVKSQKSSAGKVSGTSGAKIGNPHLTWAYSEAAVLFLQKNPPGQPLINRLRSKHGRPKALSILAARIGRASCFTLRRSTPFDMDRFLN